MHVAEQAPLFGRAEGRSPRELDSATDVVEQRRGEQEVGAQPGMELGELAADRRDADRVLEEAAGVAVMPLDCCRQGAETRSQLAVLHEATDGGLQARMR